MVFAEALTEYLIDGLSEALAKADEPIPPAPLPTDRYVTLSALQRAVRRGEEELAIRAAMNLMIGGPQAIWRRLCVIAFEDIGVANVDLVGWTTVVINNSELLKGLGGDWPVADFLVRALCRSAKSRATDELIYLVEQDPAFAEQREELSGFFLRQRINLAISCNRGLEPQALATWYAIGTDKISSAALAPAAGCPENTFDALRDADYPGAAVEIARMGLKRTGSILAAMLHLLTRALGSGDHQTQGDPLPPEIRIGPVPSWVFDMHTRGGLSAFGRCRRQSERMRAFLAEHAEPSANLNRLVGHLVFAIESGLLRKRLVWEEGRRSELVRLDLADLEFVREGLVVTLRRSKTDQEVRAAASAFRMHEAGGAQCGRRRPGWMQEMLRRDRCSGHYARVGSCCRIGSRAKLCRCWSNGTFGGSVSTQPDYLVIR